jgi:tetratricopeptide (TPR) repeat protein
VGLGYRAPAHFQAGRYEQALRTIEQSLLLYPFMYSLKDKIVLCEKLGRHEEALDAVGRLRAVCVGEAEITIGLSRSGRIRKAALGWGLSRSMQLAVRSCKRAHEPWP